MKRTLVVFELKEEVDCFLSHKSIDELRSKNTRVLALMPETQVYLKKMGIPFFDSYQFFGAEGHRQALLQSERMSNLCRSLNMEDDIGIKEGYRNFFLFSLRLYVNYLLWLIEVIKNACVQLNIEKIILFDRDNRHIEGPFLSPAEGYAGEMGAAVAGHLGIEQERFLVPENTRNLFFGKFKLSIAEFIKFFSYQMKFNFLMPALPKRKIILATVKSYNLGRVIGRFSQAFGNSRAIYLNSGKKGEFGKFIDALFSASTLPLPAAGNIGRKNIFRNKLRNSMQNLKTAQGVAGAFSFGAVSFKDAAFKKIEEDIIPALCGIYSQSIYLDNFLRRFNPALIISQMARGINFNMGELASLRNIPSLLISHGSHVPPENEYEAIEWKEHGSGLINTCYKYVALQSPLAKAYIDKIPIKSEPVITGPLLFANISGKKKPAGRNDIVRGDKIILLHADTPRLRGTFRFYVYQTVDEYIAGINSLIRAVEKAGGYHLIIRFRPQYFLSEEHLKNLLIESSCYSIHSGGNFEDYLSASDMLVSYSSTTIEESLQNKTPVLLYDPHGKYCHIKGATVLDMKRPVAADSCYYIGDEAQLKDSLEWLKKNHFSSKEPRLEWDRYVFKEEDRVELTSYFKGLFQ